MIQNVRNLCVLMTLIMLPLAVAAERYYVKPDAKEAVGTGSWNNATTLSDALTKAKANDEIWLLEGIYKPSTQEGFKLKSGVSIYGGFNGTETSIDDREIVDGKAYRMANQTILSGDIDGDDTIDNVNLIFPANGTRTGNATHVLTINLDPTEDSQNNNTYPTIVDGVTIARGHAVNGNVIGGEYGGGIFVTGNNSGGGVYILRRCFFVENYATQGGALYVDASVQNTANECLIDRCGFFNNAAGTRGDMSNSGGAIYLEGAGTVVNSAIFNNENGGIYLDNSEAKVINSTVTRNTGSGIDGNSSTHVTNTVIWGNALLSTEGKTPDFSHCAYPEANATSVNNGNNVYLAAKNNEADGPHFSSPSLKTGYDTDFDPTVTRYPLWTWEPMEATPLVDKGNTDAYKAINNNEGKDVDLNGDQRIQGTAIDIGAFEFQPVDAGRIRYVIQGATGNGTSWDNASGDLQRMIDELAESGGGQPGEVWVAAGTYEPQAQLITGTSYSASFRMRDGISVYGGFAGNEINKTDRAKADGAMPWQFANETILQAAYYSHENLELTNNKWTLTSDSRHVVWFAPLGSDSITRPTYLDGVTIMGGYAQGGTGLDDFMTDRGAGVYMDSQNAYLTNCTVKENYATGNGGGVYLRDGRVQSSLIYNNNADGNGGAVYVDDRGLVHRSMLTNNTARNGAGAYLDNKTPADNEPDHPEYLILSTCVVSNNTATGNGAVYCNNGGVLLQNTVTNNRCTTSTDATDPNASQTGGLYLNGYGLVVNSVIWNNRTGSSRTNVPMYAKNPTADKVRFLYNAISGVNNAVWNNILQEQTLSLVDANAGEPDNANSIGPRFEEPDASLNFDIDDDNAFGVQESWKDSEISYYWKPVNGSNLWARGMALGQLPREVVLAPEIDIEGALFAQKPAVGAFNVEKSAIVPAVVENNTLVVYVDAECSEPEHNGSSWNKAYRSINEVVSFFAGLTDGGTVETSNKGNYTIGSNTSFEIHVLEGDLWPRYAFVNEDPKTATLDILKMQSGKPLKIVGGYYRTGESTAERDPLNHRSQLNGNPDGDSLEDGFYHVVTVESGAEVELDGFHIINGYAAGTASLQYGAGVLVHDNATVTLTNCILENNTAVNGAAIDARNATLTMNNCVVNNNTNTTTTNAVINAANLTLNHVTVVNNDGAAPSTETIGDTSFSAGNTSNNSLPDLATTGENGGAANFANPTNKAGATLGFDTYLGGYSVFRPLTSSSAAASHIINQVNTSTGLTTDIMGNERDLGGVPDLGAYEADLPKAGKVIYVRSYNTVWDGDRENIDGTPDMALSTAGDGSSWNNAINGNAVCDVTVTKDNNFYVKSNNQQLIQSSYDEEAYREGGPYRPRSGSYGNFWDAEGNDNNQPVYDGWRVSYYYNKITNNRDEQYVSGLQYAVEQAAKYNADLQPGEDSVEVWVGAGIYTDYKGFVIRDRVRVLGGFPHEGTPGEADRHPLLSDYISARDADEGLTKSDYETILQVRKETPVTWNGLTPSASSTFSGLNGTQRHYVLYQPDVCLPTWNVAGSGDGNDNTTNSVYKRTSSNQYRYPFEGNNYEDTNYKEYQGATWDGFTIRHGYIKNYTSNRDGGAGVRMFRGVTLQNMVIVNNLNHIGGGRNRGGGLYMDSDNGRINNSFIMQNCVNLNNPSDNYGGGAYIIVGTGYNLVVANNYSAFKGGGIFIESATFYNNTVAYNTAVSGGSGLFQYQDPKDKTRASSLTLYNCLFYGNSGGTTIESTTADTFNEAYNCYVAGSLSSSLNGKFTTATGNQVGTYLANPFDKGTEALSSRDFRLASSSNCVNKGAEYIDRGNGQVDYFDLPETDMDFTDRIKDCTVDIGAYELENLENTKPYTGYSDGHITATYFVTQNGNGTASGNSPANAACAEKLQTVLKAAGIYKQEHTDYEVIVKVAGYSDNEDDPLASGFVYHANTLANENDPQSYSYTIPYGVILKGGYDEFPEDGSGWNDSNRDVIAHPTKLSAIKSATSTEQEVNGYHVVTFSEKPTEGWTGGDQQTIVDGVWLIDGSATSLAGTGNANTRGGGAIVPAWAHVRNCIVQGNEAVQGGGLYVLPGGTVSGTAVLGNTADDGGGIYADNTDAGDSKRAHIISCTIADNTADDGGGIYLEDGAAMSVNTVIWGNTASSNKNVSGVTAQRFKDNELESVFNLKQNDGYYPFNDCFIESMELPSDLENSSMESDSTLYFMDGLRRLKEFSPLIKHGLKSEYQDELEATFGVAAQDMQNTDRDQSEENGTDRLDAGAFAYLGGILPDDLFTRIFVSQTTNVKLSEGAQMINYLGRSFYTSFSTLEDALAYIRSMREGGKNSDVKFEILMGGGTYKPNYQRTDASETVSHDQRLYSFVIPEGVSIYGGFSGEELISTEGTESIPAEGGEMTLADGGQIEDILSARGYSDFNGNGINEPWELANQTILSGNINVSSEAKNSYHVIYSSTTNTNANANVLDGLTVMDGETYDKLTSVTEKDEAGRGGGLYSNGIPYTINRCRFMNNFGIRGGAVYVRDARLNVIGSIFAGNGPVEEATTSSGNQPPRGGAIFIGASESTTAAQLFAVNSLFVNNESAGEGGAIGTTYAEGVTANYDPLLDIMNCTFARNKAATNAVIYNHNGKSKLTNTLIWGNKSDNYDTSTDAAEMQISHSASDYDYGKKFSTGTGNVVLDEDNSGTNGPRFTRPSTKAGVEGNDATNLWNPVAISIATDGGDGIYPADNNNTDDAYTSWFTTNGLSTYADQYMSKSDASPYNRYSGPFNEDGSQADRPIDIGVYEYQYISNFQTMKAIYVATEESGNGSGNSWANATSDLRGAIVGASNPTVNDGDRTVYVKDGEYSLPRLSAGTAYVLNMSDWESFNGLTVKGSCTGVGEEQNFNNQSVIRNHENSEKAGTLLTVNSNDKNVRIEGFTFINDNTDGVGISANAGTGSFTLANSAMRGNSGSGLKISDNNSGKVLIYNTLFADGGTGLDGGGDNVTLVNTTFANNTTDMNQNLENVYNSVSWNNKEQHMPADTDNKLFGSFTETEALTNNANIEEGPNFVDPLNDNKELRDYHIRPSLTLLNAGANDNYVNHVLHQIGYDESVTEIPDTEKDLGNNKRLTDKTIDIGAYEYEAPLQPIVYVKADVVSETKDGRSWQTALSDLQGAADLVGIYASQHTDDNASGYVFVHNNVRSSDENKIDVSLTLPNTKVYGGMNDETSSTSIYDEDGNLITNGINEEVTKIVDELLSKRSGLIERASNVRSTLTDVTVNANGAVVDGFEVSGKVNLGNGGYLSTSVVKSGATISGVGTDEGILYNTLVYGDVQNVKAVNVTATGTIGTEYNNNPSAAENTYVEDEDWKYQLMETASDDIDKGNAPDEARNCIDAVGHDRDIAGNKRIRGTVDNGCFETWDINTEDGEITTSDYPHGKSVVYVREGKELSINGDVYNTASPFNPGVLLLEHQAGLRGNGNSVALSNVIMERKIAKGGVDMAFAPFTVTDFKNDNKVSVKYYDAAKRAAYAYKFAESNSEAWTDATTYGNTGLLLDNTGGTSEAKVRFIGTGSNVYTEGKDITKTVTLVKNNFSDPWTSTNPGTSNKFTHKENMSWNLFGSPYLCAMNYSEMEYGRVIYGYKDNSYVTVNTDTETVPTGHIPAGDAVFTQTATLKNEETFNVEQPSGMEGYAYESMSQVEVAITRTGETRAEGESTGDVLQLNAVAKERARTDFDIGSDGVKWMTDSVAQIYAEQGGGRYSLLSAVNIEGKVNVGVTLPEPGMYTISVPDDCPAEGYESVVLEDNVTGAAVNLLEGGYDFTSGPSGDIAGRFTISFNRMIDDNRSDNIRAYFISRDVIRVEGVEPDDRISVYSADGMAVAQRIAASSTEDINVNIAAVAIVKVEREGKAIRVIKLIHNS